MREEYKFYYDESEHSRIINQNTLTSRNYYDNFVTVIVGWKKSDEETIKKRYEEFENKYEYRKTNGELKSESFKNKWLKYGFSSVSKKNLEYIEDFLAIFDDSVMVYSSVFSKVEYVIKQIIRNCNNTTLANTNHIMYTLTKAINVYHPRKVIESLCGEKEDFLVVLKEFLMEKIQQNKANFELKDAENKAFIDMLILLNEVNEEKKLEWNYESGFVGFKKYLDEMGIEEYTMVIDREGDEQKTLNSAGKVGLKNFTDGDSKQYFGIRMADMFAGLMTKIMKELSTSLKPSDVNNYTKKCLLDEKWFVLDERQLGLYKKLFHVVWEVNNAWYKFFSGIFSDDLIEFTTLLAFLNHFNNAEEIKNDGYRMQAEYYNYNVCERLLKEYKRM